MIYWELFWAFLQVGLFSFGGGYAALPQIQHQITQNNWLTLQEFADIVAISEMTPGPIAINAATFVGTRLAGVAGAVVATVGCVLPGCLLVLVLGWLYMKYRSLKPVQGVLQGLRPAVVAMIASAALGVLVLVLFGDSLPQSVAQINWWLIAAVTAGVLIQRIWKVNPIFIIVGGGLLSLAWYWLSNTLAA